MKITFLGTCACDFSPLLETELKDKFDKNARRSSSMLIDDRFLVDCGIHTLQSLSIAKKKISAITDVFITHLHRDHYNVNNINEIAKSSSSTLRVWARSDAKLDGLENVEIMRMDQFKQYEVGDSFSVIGLDANHDQNVSPQHLYFKTNDKNLFYGCDGAWMFNKTYYFLKDKKLDLCVLDCTSGDYMGDFRMGEHNSIPMLRVMLPSLRTFKVIDDHSAIYFSHLAPSLHDTHDNTVKIAKTLGASVAYDGLEINI